MRETANYGFRKPELNEYLSVEDINHNSDLIDLELKKANERSDKLTGVKTITLLAADWSTIAPYIQTVNVAGVTAEDSPVIGILIADETTAANVKAQNKAWGCVDRAVTGAGIITFYCYNKKPAVDFQAALKGM